MERYDGKQSKIFVDADACPVKEEIIQLGHIYDIDTIFVASYAHFSSSDLGGKWVYVDAMKEEVDLYIMNHAKENDITVTQDIGLASILVKRGVYVLSPRGKQFVEKNMDTILQMRYLSAKERRSGNHSKGPAPYTEEDRKNFFATLQKKLSNLAGFTT